MNDWPVSVPLRPNGLRMTVRGRFGVRGRKRRLAGDRGGGGKGRWGGDGGGGERREYGSASATVPSIGWFFLSGPCLLTFITNPLCVLD